MAAEEAVDEDIDQTVAVPVDDSLPEPLPPLEYDFLSTASRVTELKLKTVDEILETFMHRTADQLSEHGGKPHVVQAAQFMSYLKRAYPKQLHGEFAISSESFERCLGAILRAPAARKKGE